MIVQCPQKCGRLVYQGVFEGRADWLNAGGAWQGYPHMCGFDGANERGDNDDAPTRAEELVPRPHQEAAPE